MLQKSRPMTKRHLRIGELSSTLKVEKYIVRYWEKEFELSPQRSAGRQRFYTADDLETFMHIKELLYQKGFTIAGARQQITLRKNGAHSYTPAQSLVTTSSKQCVSCQETASLKKKIKQLTLKIHALQKQLTGPERS